MLDNFYEIGSIVFKFLLNKVEEMQEIELFLESNFKIFFDDLKAFKIEFLEGRTIDFDNRLDCFRRCIQLACFLIFKKFGIDQKRKILLILKRFDFDAKIYFEEGQIPQRVQL